MQNIAQTSASELKVEIWSDIVCPWCYVGKREFENALGRFSYKNNVVVKYRSFQLDPYASKKPMLRSELPQINSPEREERRKYLIQRASEVGLEFHYDKVMTGNTFDAHRLIHLASDYGFQNEAEERLMKAVFVDGLPFSNRDTLLELASEIGLNKKEATAVLDSDLYANEVLSDEAMASSIGITGVPFYIVGEKFGVSGAQSSEFFLEVLDKAWADSRSPLRVVSNSNNADSCDDGSCSVNLQES